MSDPRVAVLVPRRADGGRRDDIWAYVKSRWDDYGYEVTEGHHDDGGPFNRSAAINQASRSAGDWDVAVIADSDTFVGQEQVRQAVDAAHTVGWMVLGYSRFVYLNRRYSDLIMQGFDGAWEPGIQWQMFDTCSSMVVVRRDIWDQARGFDEGFVGWGSEDIAFSHAAQTFGGGLLRISGEAWHLFHEPATEARDPESMAVKNALAERYHQAHGDKAAMRALIDELRGPDDPAEVAPHRPRGDDPRG